MSLYKIARACGHEEEVQIRGTNVHGERETRAKYLERFDCGDCVWKAKERGRAEAAERATAIAEDNGWPDLAGSDKQIPWAQDIRALLLAALVDMVPDPAALDIYRTAALRQTAAHWWIDRRGLAMAKPVDRDYLEALGSQRKAVRLLDTIALRHGIGSLVEEIETVMTPAERAALAETPPSAETL